MKRLPPLTAVEAFVQTARLGSVQGGGGGARSVLAGVTRRVQAIERHVGRPLFERRRRAVHLNAEGDAAARRGRAGARRARPWRWSGPPAGGLMRLRLGALPLFASHRLMPSLGALREAHPDLHIDIDTQPHALARLDEGLDAAIVLARDIEPPLYARRLGRNRVVAIGGRELAEGPDALSAPADIAPPHRAAAPRSARRVRLLARGGRAAGPRAGGGRPFRFAAS